MEISNLLKVYISKDIVNVVQKYFYLCNCIKEDNYMELQKYYDRIPTNYLCYYIYDINDNVKETKDKNIQKYLNLKKAKFF